MPENNPLYREPEKIRVCVEQKDGMNKMWVEATPETLQARVANATKILDAMPKTIPPFPDELRALFAKLNKSKNE